MNTYVWVNKWFYNFCKSMSLATKHKDVYASAKDVERNITRFSSVNNFYFGKFVITLNPSKGLVTIFHRETGKIGKAVCRKEDKFDRITGLAIAWARYCNETVPILENISVTELKCGDEFFDLGEKYIFVGKSPIFERYICYKVTDGVYTLTSRYWDNSYSLVRYSDLGNN